MLEISIIFKDLRNAIYYFEDIIHCYLFWGMKMLEKWYQLCMANSEKYILNLTGS